ncbi:MAG: DUF2933 domain-containing protein [Bacteroidaceae bacterium]|nr:DUF2933 domain-containing protein [Bacteroidaceae bacterium]
MTFQVSRLNFQTYSFIPYILLYICCLMHFNGHKGTIKREQYKIKVILILIVRRKYL